MAEHIPHQSSSLNPEQQSLLDDFCRQHTPRSPLEQSFVDQAASQLRDQLEHMGLVITTPEQFHTAVVVSTAVAANMRRLAEHGASMRTAEDAAALTIAALRPETMHS